MMDYSEALRSCSIDLRSFDVNIEHVLGPVKPSPRIGFRQTGSHNLDGLTMP